MKEKDLKFALNDVLEWKTFVQASSSTAGVMSADALSRS